MDNPEKKPGAGPSLAWLGVGAVAGLAFAAFGLLDGGESGNGLPAGAAARVNDAIISADQFERSSAQLAAGLGRALTEVETGQLLQQLVDEELLLQRGFDLGVHSNDLTVRTAVIQSMIASVTAEADAADPDDAALEAFLTDNAGRYTFASAMKLDAWTADDEGDARLFLNQLIENPDAWPGDGLQRVPGLPDSPVPLERLRMFVGPAIAASTADMPIGSGAVFARQGRWYVVRVVSREDSVIADLDSIRSQVLLDYRRDLADRQLTRYLDDLRERADIQVALPE